MLTPTRTLKPGMRCRASTSAAMRAASSTIASPARTAFSASSSCASSAPNAASMLSPAYCRTRPFRATTSAENPRERAVQDRVHVLRVERAAHRGRSDDVHEQHRHRLQLLLAIAVLRPQLRELLAHRRGAGVHHGVAEQRALALQRGDRCVELFDGCGHATGSCEGGVAHDASAQRMRIRRMEVAPGWKIPCERMEIRLTFRSLMLRRHKIPVVCIRYRLILEKRDFMTMLDHLFGATSAERKTT